ncbi:MAG: hypothetical protein KAW92_13850, partial [Candidatus Cloacimonetes bacterium]|nr:hypothetical protein [Candidatus Cloacimonadota bacterium]
MVIKGEVEKNDWLDTDGSFFIKLVGVSESQGKFSTVVQFIFEVLDDSENEGKQVTGMSSKRVTPDNKTSQWLSALDPNFEFEIGKEFDFESFVGKVCRGLVAESSGDGGRTYYNIVKMRALKPEESKKLKTVDEKVEKKEPEKETKKLETEAKPSKVDDDD